MRLRLRQRLAARDERGFSLVLTVMVMFVVTALLAGAFDAVFFNTQATRNDLDQKRALLAAEAGMSIYQQQLNSNPNYWDTCPAGGTTGLTGLSVPGSTDNGSTEYYSYKTLPATGSTGCNAASPIPTTIESTGAAAGSFRAEFTGSSGKITRTIVAQFQPPSFLDYIYFTNYEIGDPAALGESPSLTTYCTNYYWAGRNDDSCGGAIDFITGDAINGPLHSNDDLAVCGSPSFGSTSPTSPDTVEAAGIVDPDGCPANAPTINGAPVSASNEPTNNPLQLPANDAQLEAVADGGNASHTNGCYAGAGCVFTGPTTIVLNGNTLNITNTSFNGGVQDAGVAWPSNGVIYVQNSTCTPNYNPGSVTYGSDPGCGDATVSGNYSSSLTIGTDNDIIINGSITQTGLSPANSPPSGQSLLGLVANKFVRVAHPVSGTCSFSPYNNSATNSTSGIYSSLTNPVIDAAILALGGSFIVDNFECGNTPLGTLTVWGAIAQDFRGFVGTENGNGNVATGYLKSYNYDTRLATLSPPSFLNPVTDWTVDRVTECGDATGAC